MKKEITFKDIKNNQDVNTYIKNADRVLEAMGYTEHSFGHVTKVAYETANILEKLGYDQREVELAKIAGYMHDIGNVINRHDHAQSGALIAYRVLDQLGMDPEEISVVIAAIGNHDEASAFAISGVTAALIIADKSDVRKTRVRLKEKITDIDIHDRVNGAVESSELDIFDTEEGQRIISLNLQIDTSKVSVIEYFEIFIDRMLLCRRAADSLGAEFKLVINGAVLL